MRCLLSGSDAEATKRREILDILCTSTIAGMCRNTFLWSSTDSAGVCAATCYLNSWLQTLFNLNVFRQVMICDTVFWPANHVLHASVIMNPRCWPRSHAACLN